MLPFIHSVLSSKFYPCFALLIRLICLTSMICVHLYWIKMLLELIARNIDCKCTF